MRGTLALVVLGLLATSAATAGADEAVPSLLAEGRGEEAIAALYGQIKAWPDDALAHNLLCRAYFSLGQWDRGISDCEKAVSLAPQESQYHLGLGRIYGQKADKTGFMTAAGLARRGRTEFEAAGQLNPKNVRARSGLAHIELESSRIVSSG